MLKIFYSVFVILVFSNTTACAKDGSTINGSTNLNKAEYANLEVNGSLTFTDLFIKEYIIVNGSVNGINLKCQKIETNGSVDIDGLQAQDIESNGSFLGRNINIAGDARFNGGVKIINGKLHNIQISSTKSTIIDTQVNGDIHIKKVNNEWSFLGLKVNESSTQILELKGHTIVSGDVVFESEGEVHLFNGAKIEGKIINAKSK